MEVSALTNDLHLCRSLMRLHVLLLLILIFVRKTQFLASQRIGLLNWFGTSASVAQNTSNAWNEDVLVLFSNSWCGFCQRMDLVVREVLQSLKGYMELLNGRPKNKIVVISNDSLKAVMLKLPLIYRIDCTWNDYSWILKSVDQASQSGYSVDFGTQGLQSGFPGSFLNQNSQGGYSRYGSGNDFMTQDYMGQGSEGLFTQVGFSDPSQEDGSQGHFSNANSIQPQVLKQSEGTIVFWSRTWSLNAFTKFSLTEMFLVPFSTSKIKYQIF